MKRIYLSLLGIVLVSLLGSCTKYNFVEVKDPKTHHDTTMWEYFSTDKYNWELTQQMIEHAGLRDIFEGKSQYGTDFTFFGFTSISIKRYLMEQKTENQLEENLTVADLPKEDCKRWILSCIYPKRLMLDDWAAGRPVAGEAIGTGGKMCKMASGVELWIYTYRSTFNGVPEMGPKQIHLVSEDKQSDTTVGSHNISTNTGVVHALEYNFTLNDI